MPETDRQERAPENVSAAKASDVGTLLLEYMETLNTYGLGSRETLAVRSKSPDLLLQKGIDFIDDLFLNKQAFLREAQRRQAARTPEPAHGCNPE